MSCCCVSTGGAAAGRLSPCMLCCSVSTGSGLGLSGDSSSWRSLHLGAAGLSPSLQDRSTSAAGVGGATPPATTAASSSTWAATASRSATRLVACVVPCTTAGPVLHLSAPPASQPWVPWPAGCWPVGCARSTSSSPSTAWASISRCRAAASSRARRSASAARDCSHASFCATRSRCAAGSQEEGNTLRGSLSAVGLQYASPGSTRRATAVRTESWLRSMATAANSNDEAGEGPCLNEAGLSTRA